MTDRENCNLLMGAAVVAVLGASVALTACSHFGTCYQERTGQYPIDTTYCSRSQAYHVVDEN